MTKEELEKQKLKRFHLRWKIIFIFLLSLGLVFVLFPLRSYISEQVEKVRASSIANFENTLGLSIRYDSLSPSVFSRIELRGVELINKSSVVILRLKKIDIYYNIFALLFGDAAVSTIGIENLALDLEQERDSYLVDIIKKLFFPDTSKVNETSAVKKIQNFSIVCRNVDIKFASIYGFGLANLKSLSFGFKNTQAFFSLDGILNGEGRDFLSTIGVIKLPLKIDFEQINENEARMNTQFSLVSSLVNIKTQKILLTLRNNLLEVYKIEDVSPIDFYGAYNLTTSDFSMKIQTQNLFLSKLFSFSKALSSYNPLLDSTVTGLFNISGSVNKKLLDFSGSLNASVPKSVKTDAGFSVSFSGNSKRLFLENLRYKDPDGSFTFDGDINLKNFLPEGSAKIDYKVNKLLFASELTLTRTEKFTELFADTLSLGNSILNSVVLRIEPNKNTIEYTLAAYQRQNNYVLESTATLGGEAISDDTRVGQLSSEGSIILDKNPFVQGSLSLYYMNVGTLGSWIVDALKIENAFYLETLSDFTISAEAFVTTDFKSIAYNAPEIVLSYDKKAGNFGVFSIAGSQNRIEVNKLSAFWDGYRFEGNIFADYADPNAIVFNAGFKLQEINYTFDGTILGGNSVLIQGDYGLSFSVSSLGTELSASLKTVNLPLPVSVLNYRPRLSIDAIARYKSIDDFSVFVRSLKIMQMDTSSQLGLEFSCIGSFDQNVGKLSLLQVQDHISTLQGKADFKYNLSKLNANVIADLKSVTREKYTIDISVNDSKLQGNCKITASPLIRFVDPVVQGSIDAELFLSGSLRKPDFSLNWKLGEGRLANIPLDAKGIVLLKEERLSVEKLSIDFVFNHLRNGVLLMDINDFTSTLQADYLADFGQNKLTSNLSAFGSFSEDVSGLKQSPLYEFSGFLQNIKFPSIDIASVPLKVLVNDKKINLAIGPGSEITGEYKYDGNFIANLKSPFPVEGNLIGIKKADKIEAMATSVKADMPLIWKCVNIPELDFLTGTIEGDLKVSGLLSDPDYYGILKANNISASMSGYIPSVIGPISTSVTVEGKDITMPKLDLKVGNAEVSGLIRLKTDRWLPSEAWVKVEVKENKPLYAKTNLVDISMEGNVSGRLDMFFSSPKIDVTGSLRLEDALVYLEKKPSSGEKKRNDNVFANIAIKTGRNVEFLWPPKPLTVLRGYVEQDSALAITFYGPTGDFSVKGSVAIRGGDVFWFKRSFFLKEGLIVFNENAKSPIDPYITLKAEMRDRNESGPLTIYLIIDHNRISSMKPRFEASPSMTEASILAMLGGSLMTIDSDSKTVLSQAFVSATDLLTQTGVLSYFEQNVRNTFGLDMFTIRTQVIQNMLLQTVFTDSQSTATSSLSTYLDNTSIYMGKYIGSDLFAQVMLQLQAQENVGSIPTLQLDSEIGLEMVTPYFLLQWSLLPAHPENLFISDQKFTFSWRFSY